MAVDVDDGFEVIESTEVDASENAEDISSAPPKQVRKLCACGCGETVNGNRALKRGHTIGTGITQQWAPEDLLVLQTAVVTFLMAVTAFVEKKRNVPRMELEEAQAIGNPVGRIAARHFRWKHIKPGDAADVASIVVALSAYTMRIFSDQKKQEVPVATNGFVNNQGISGLGQYQYRPPDQGFQSQNDIAA